MTDHSHTELLARLAAAPWHHSPGYNRKRDATRVGKHSYILSKDGEDVDALITDMFALIASDDPCIWRGRYQGRGFVYRYLTMHDDPEQWTFWRMREGGLINRDHIDRAEREVQPGRARNQTAMES